MSKIDERDVIATVDLPPSARARALLHLSLLTIILYRSCRNNSGINIDDLGGGIDVTIGTTLTSAAGENDDMNGFGDFGEAETGSKHLQDEFGDFSTTTSLSVAPGVDPHGDLGDFGDFGEVPVSTSAAPALSFVPPVLTATTTTSTNDIDNVDANFNSKNDDDDFGDFDEASTSNQQQQTQQELPATSAMATTTNLTAAATTTATETTTATATTTTTTVSELETEPEGKYQQVDDDPFGSLAPAETPPLDNFGGLSQPPLLKTSSEPLESNSEDYPSQLSEIDTDEKLLACLIRNEFFKQARILSSQSETSQKIRDLDKAKAVAAMGDRFEEALEIRKKVRLGRS